MDLPDRMALFRESDLYVVISEDFCAHHAPLDVLEACLCAGVRLVQMREKSGSGARLYAMARAYRERTRAHGALFIMDDRTDLALAADADGVHLGQEDLPIKAARAIAPNLIIGASSHNRDEAIAAEADGASYVNIGPIFDTQTKAVPSGAVGPAMIDAIAPHLGIPFTCMGGIKAHNAGEVLARGARHIAVVTAVTGAKDPGAAAAQLRTAILSARS